MKLRLPIIIIAFSLSLILMTVLSFISVKQFGNLLQTIDNVEQAHRTISGLDQLEMVLKDIDRLERGYIITRNRSYLNLVEESSRRLLPLTEQLKSMTADNPRQYAQVVLIRSHLVHRLTNLRRNLHFADTSSFDAVSEHFEEGHQSTEQSMLHIRKMKDSEEKFLAQQHSNKVTNQQLTASYIKYIVFGFGLITLILFTLIISEFLKRLSYQRALQLRIIDLNRSHEEMEQIAFASSHNLQEPLRKMQVFINKFLWKKQDLEGDERHTITRISDLAAHMQHLASDMARLASLTRKGRKRETVRLDQVLDQAREDLRHTIAEHKAVIIHDTLPAISGYHDQLSLLFRELLSNALKFSHPERRTEISVKCSRIQGHQVPGIHEDLSHLPFHLITFSDNGIGFQNDFGHKIFQLFQRLHNDSACFPGNGTGLAIARKVMTNHKGYISATGTQGAGARFTLYFRADK